MATYQAGSMPCDELEEEYEICPKLEFLEDLGLKPPPEAYHAASAYGMGGEGEEEEEEKEDGYRTGEEGQSQSVLMPPSGG